MDFILAVAMLMGPGAAIACACCGHDDTWSVRSISADAIKELQLGPGRFLPNGPVTELEWSVSSVELVERSFVFKTDLGAFFFDPSAVSAEHREVDINFVTHPESELIDEADIYHEIILTGILRMPDSAAKHMG